MPDPMKDSASFEKVVEHVFVAELLQETWFRRDEIAEVLHAEVDAWGYDLVVEVKGTVRHIQLKAPRADSKTASVVVNDRLARKPGGCVVWLAWSFDKKADRMRFTYRWLGGRPGKKLPPLAKYKVAKHTRANAEGVKAERPGTRRVPIRDFEKLDGIADLVDRLFG